MRIGWAIGLIGLGIAAALAIPTAWAQRVTPPPGWRMLTPWCANGYVDHTGTCFRCPAGYIYVFGAARCLRCPEGLELVEPTGACAKPCPRGQERSGEACTPAGIVERGWFGCPAGYVDHPADPDKCVLPYVAERMLRRWRR